MVLSIEEIIAYDYCPHYHQYIEKNGIGQYESSLKHIVKAVMNRYWLERATGAEPTFETLQQSIKNIALKSGGNIPDKLLLYLKKIIARSAKISYETLIDIDSILTYSPTSSTIVQTFPNTILKTKQDNIKIIYYPFSSTDMGFNPKTTDRMAANSLTINSTFLTEEFKEIDEILAVYPVKTIRIRRAQTNIDSAKDRILHSVNGIVDSINFYRTGGWCSTCKLRGNKSLCQAGY